MEAVAHRAGASKATVYRRWPSRGALLVDAMDSSFQALPLPATGELRADLLELMAGQGALLGGRPFPRLMAAFMDAAERDPTLASLHVELTERRREPVLRVPADAVRRGEIPPATDLDLAVDLLAGPAFYRRFIAYRAIPEGYAGNLGGVVLVLAVQVLIGSPTLALLALAAVSLVGLPIALGLPARVRAEGSAEALATRTRR
jgi:AcrR family transcriptional regulator